ncbi:VanW family protein [Metabacillus sp. GX 13764]|uniref:VanW family protein n=1 Tax=Metabacillus kandeliae TaxID=2900151 RepID=UPI001E6416A6|nr:VanW family protein [Metabacillus kandeliae]MCD7033556.1 VanW family protein [Metabacillus kandeliae]
MFRISLLLSLFLLAAGCSTNGSKPEEKESAPKDMSEASISLSHKDYSLKVQLLDERSGKVMATYNPNDKSQNAKELAAELADKIDQPMVPARLDSAGNVTGGKSRVVLDEKETAKRLNDIKAFDKEIILPIQETKPTVANVPASAMNKVIGSYKTTFNASITGRTENIAISAKEINNVILGPGDRFYFNLVVGDRTEARGYQKALEIVNKEYKEGIGGGVCQTSSTLYNAVDKAGLEMLELHHHSKHVGYVPEGRDATVAYGFKDFKFMNNKDYPVKLKAAVDKKAGWIEIQVLAAQTPAVKS